MMGSIDFFVLTFTSTSIVFSKVVDSVENLKPDVGIMTESLSINKGNKGSKKRKEKRKKTKNKKKGKKD